MKKALRALTLCAGLAGASAAWATPSTTVWAPSTTYTQPFLVPHLTYDTYFTKGAGRGYPVTTGLTIGVLPYDAVQAEVGFDLLFPTDDPVLLNGKVTLVEDKLFAYQPALSLGVANAGVTAATDLAMVYAVLGKTIPGVGASVAIGGYYGLNGNLWVDKNGAKEQAGLLASVASPPIKVGAPVLDSIVLAADVQTGKNAFGAAGVAASFYFTPNVALLTGPVFFLEKALQPNGSSYMWTVQLDLDAPLRKAN
jgi:hypothetical protein